jgi:hypothetical protein
VCLTERTTGGRACVVFERVYRTRFAFSWTDSRVFVKKMENVGRGVHTGTNIGNVSIEFITLHARVVEI